VLPSGDEDNEDGAETARDPGKNRDIRDLKDMKERLDECGVEGPFEATVDEEAEAGNRVGIGPRPVDDVELDVGGFFSEDRVGAGGSMSGEVTRRGGVS
jgi:hypothetical protein